MNWFIGTFLKSLDERINATDSQSIWVSEKQVNICRKYMKPTSVYSNYYIVVGDMQYTLSVMQKGYGRMSRCDKRIAIR